MAAGELDMEKTDFSMTNATTFDHHTAKITAFFIQASCCCRRCFSCSRSFLSFPIRPLATYLATRAKYQYWYFEVLSTTVSCISSP